MTPVVYWIEEIMDGWMDGWMDGCILKFTIFYMNKRING